MPRALPVFMLAFVAFSLYKIYPGSPGAPLIPHKFSGPSMGTTYNITVAEGHVTKADKTRIQKSIVAVMDKVDNLMSTYKKDSEISRFNKWEETTLFKISPLTAEVIGLSLDISAKSGGVFDITLAPLVNAWGFGPNMVKTRPTQAQLKELTKYVGWQHLKLNQKENLLAKSDSRMMIDLSAIAKGYAVDRVSIALHALGYQNHMVEIGGEIRTSGLNLEHKPWNIGIEKPDPNHRIVHDVLALSGHAVATSGDYRNFHKLNGQKVSHTIDPRTLHPIAHPLTSVTVIDRHCATADGWATALNVLGPNAGYALATKLKIAARFISMGHNNNILEKSTEEYQKFSGILKEE